MRFSFGQSIIRCARAAPFGLLALCDDRSDCDRINTNGDDQSKRSNRQELLRMLMSMIPVVLLACIIVGCDNGEESSTVRGKILDKTSQLPIDSAWVNTIDTTDGARYCDVEGTFSLTTFGRIQKFYAGKVGYTTRLIELPDDEDARQNVIVELEKIQQSK